MIDYDNICDECREECKWYEEDCDGDNEPCEDFVESVWSFSGMNRYR